MGQFETFVTLPFHNLERATAALRGSLRLQAAYALDRPGVPNWDKLVITELEPGVDDHGRTWWRWSATADTLHHAEVGSDTDSRITPDACCNR